MNLRQARPIVVAVVGVFLVVVGIVVAINHHSAAPTPNAASAPVSPRPRTTPTVVAPSSVPAVPYVTHEGPPVPKRGAYLGAWVYPDPFTQDGRVSSFTDYEKTVGRPLSIVHLYRTWGMPIGTPSDLAFARSHKYLLLSWAPVNLNKITSGQQDAVIRATARQIAALPTTVFLEFRWEMDRPNLDSIVHSPQEFIAAWKHVRAIFEAMRVPNVAWTWCPTASGFADGQAQSYYPGDSQVDWVCADVYPTTPWEPAVYESFSLLAGPFMSWAARHDKPVIIGEYGVPQTYHPYRARWLTEAGRYVQDHPQIKALVYFDQNLSTKPSYNQYSIQGDPAAINAFSRFAGNAYFRAARP